MENNNIETNIPKQLKEVMIKESIKKQPFSTLKECLRCYTKAKLTNIAKLHGIHLKQSQRKDEMIGIVEGTLIENISKDSFNMTSLERELLACLSSQDQIEENRLEEIKILKSLGYVYLFYYKKKFYTILPGELSDKFLESYHKKDENTIEENDEMYTYIKALVQLYGVYEVNQLIVVWNRYHREKLNKKKVYEYLDREIDEQKDFYWNFPYIISSYFKEEKEYERFLSAAHNREYYIPTEKEISYFAENQIDQENIYSKLVEEYLRKKARLKEDVLEGIMGSLTFSCIIDKPFQSVFQEIKKAGHIFRDAKEVNDFTQRCVDFNTHTRKWSLKGHKPVELIEKERLNPIPTRAPLIKRKKIGRNDPCPCGSGKKYKKCCGK